jgi:predicted Rossmann-fold nucleotide-binding protein
MKLVIAGSRFADPSDADMARLDAIHSEHEITEVVSGGAKGVDAAGEHWATSRGIPVKVFKADWGRYRRGAGPVRNKQMAQYAEAVVVFPGGSGTRNMRDEARKAGRLIFDFMTS